MTASRPYMRMLGPGLLLAATSIGGSHLVLASTAGARFGYELLWLVLVSHLFKYHAFEFGPRYAAATGHSLLHAYRQLPGPKNWLLWVGATDMVVQSVGVTAAVAGLTGAILHSSTGVLSLPAWTLIALVAVIALLVTGRYGLLMRVSGLMIVVLTLGTAVAFFQRPPSLADLSHLVRPSIPAGSILLVSALLGWMPTGVGVSLWHSLWVVEDPRYRRTADPSANLAVFKSSLFDMRLGYAISVVVGIMFLSLGAVALKPAGLVPEGTETAQTLSRLYTEMLGSYMAPVFFVVSFFAMFSTTYTVMDGMPRTLTAAVQHIRDEDNPDHATKGRLYWVFLVGMTVLSLVVVKLVPDPPRLITLLAAVTFVLSPLYFAANTYAVTRLVDDAAMRPSRGHVAFAILGIVALTITVGLVVYTEIIRGGN